MLKFADNVFTTPRRRLEILKATAIFIEGPRNSLCLIVQRDITQAISGQTERLSMKIVAISSLGANHRYVLEQFHEHFPLTLVLKPRPVPATPRSRSEKLQRWVKHPWQSLSQRLENGHFNRRLHRLEAEVADALQLELKTPSRLPVQTVAVPDLHRAEMLEQLQHLQPDLMLTSGCPLLRESLFGLPRLGTINLHWGISPAYRGEHTLFWPLYLRDYQQLGITLHQIDASIDGGPVLARGWPELAAADGEATLLAKSARIAVSLLNRLCSQIAFSDSIQGTRPEQRGRLFKSRERRWRHDFWLNCRRTCCRERLPQLPAREECLLQQ